MARFSDAAKRDPYRNFNFRIKFGNETVAACRKMSALQATVNTTKFRAGDDPSSVDTPLPGRAMYDPVSFEEGITESRVFEQWANELLDYDGRPGRLPDPQFRREVTIDVLDLDRQTVVLTYVLHDAWVSKYTAMSDLAGDGNDVLIATLEVTHIGFSRSETPGA